MTKNMQNQSVPNQKHNNNGNDKPLPTTNRKINKDIYIYNTTENNRLFSRDTSMLNIDKETRAKLRMRQAAEMFSIRLQHEIANIGNNNKNTNVDHAVHASSNQDLKDYAHTNMLSKDIENQSNSRQEPTKNGGNQSTMKEQGEGSRRSKMIPTYDNYPITGTDLSALNYDCFCLPTIAVDDITGDTLYVTGVIDQGTQAEINELISHAWGSKNISICRLNESIADIAAAFDKLARVLGVKCEKTDKFYLVLYQVWRNLYNI